MYDEGKKSIFSSRNRIFILLVPHFHPIEQSRPLTLGQSVIGSHLSVYYANSEFPPPHLLGNSNMVRKVLY